MPNKALIQALDGTPKQIVFADIGGDFSPTAANDLRDPTAGNRTDVQFAVASVANNAARQSAKVDLGEHRAELYCLGAALEFATGLTAGYGVKFYWAPSISATAGTANPGNVSGADGSYSGYSSNLDDSLRHLTFIGTFTCTADITTVVQVSLQIGYLAPRHRYGSLILVNRAQVALHSDDVEMHATLDPIIPELQ